MRQTFKFGWIPDGVNEVPFEYQNVWAREKMTGPDRLVVAPRIHQIDLLRHLSKSMQSSFLLLYVLAIPRGGSEAGRYQSEYSFSLAQLEEFLSSYETFLERDARHNLWIRANDGQGLLVYDRHNVIYAYGPLESFTSVLTDSGLTEVEQIRFPDPHSHHYHPEFDEEELRILREEQWILSPLKPGDENPV